jgi:hypothetical protein
MSEQSSINNSENQINVKIKYIEVIKSNNWIHDLIAPNFKAALLNRIKLKFNDNANSENLGIITCRAYRGEPNIWEEDCSEKLKIIDANTKLNYEFWKYAVKIVGPDSELLKSHKKHFENIHAALDVVKNHDSNSYQIFQKWISNIVFVNSNSFRSASHPHFFGILFLNPERDINDLSVSLIHELAHQELFLLNLIDRLVNSSSDFNLVHAPFQNRERPPIARLHSAHALYRMTKFSRLIQITDSEKYKSLLLKTINSLECDELTTFSNCLIKEIYNEV